MTTLASTWPPSVRGVEVPPLAVAAIVAVPAAAGIAADFAPPSSMMEIPKPPNGFSDPGLLVS